MQEIPAKFLLGVTLKSNTSFVFALFILFLSLMWAMRNHRQRRLEILKEEKTDQLIFVAGSFFFLMVLVPFFESFKREPFGEQMYGTRLDEATELDQDLEYSVTSAAVDSFSELLRKMTSLSSIDSSIASVVVLIVCIVTCMSWPKSCDYCIDPDHQPRSSAVDEDPSNILSPPFSREDLGSMDDAIRSLAEGPIIRMYESQYK